MAVLFLAGAALVLFSVEEEESEAEEARGERRAGGDYPTQFWRVFLTSFTVIFLGEWGDITQIATANYAAKYDPLTVAVGATLGLWLVSAPRASRSAPKLLQYVNVRAAAAGHRGDPRGVRDHQRDLGDPGLTVVRGSLEVASFLAEQADPARVRRDVEQLATGPRNRRWAPRAMEAGRGPRASASSSAAGWRVEVQPFTAALRLAQQRPGRPVGQAAPGPPVPRAVRHQPDRPSPRSGVRRPAVVVGAHLDTVRHSPGADDNASGVAALLEIARLLAQLDRPPAVVLAVFDLEELGLVGASVAARRLLRAGPLAGMIGLESVGYYSTAPASQRLPGRCLGAPFPQQQGKSPTASATSPWSSIGGTSARRRGRGRRPPPRSATAAYSCRTRGATAWPGR